jgi:hypothetical protein
MHQAGEFPQDLAKQLADPNGVQSDLDPADLDPYLMWTPETAIAIMSRPISDLPLEMI